MGLKEVINISNYMFSIKQKRYQSNLLGLDTLQETLDILNSR